MAVEPEFVLVQPDVFFVDNVSKVPQTPPWNVVSMLDFSSSSI